MIKINAKFILANYFNEEQTPPGSEWLKELNRGSPSATYLTDLTI
jgi:hypothetical protein